MEDEDLYWTLGLANVAIITEGLFRIIKYKGEEGKWYVTESLYYHREYKSRKKRFLLPVFITVANIH